MSEEILKALMQLFALIVKQGEGVQLQEIKFVQSFLSDQLNETTVEEYMNLFEGFAGINSSRTKSAGIKSPSVKDSVKIFAICKKINKTLTQTQKVIVLARLFELVNSDKTFTLQRMTIINTVAEVFNISKTEFQHIEFFVKEEIPKDKANKDLISIDKKFFQEGDNISGFDTLPDHKIFILQIQSTGLILLKHNCKLEVLLNGLEIKPGKIYVLPSGGSIRLPIGKPLYFSDISSRFRADSEPFKIRFEVDHVSYNFSNGETGIHDITFNERQGRMVGIMGASGTGKSTLLNLLSGLEKPTKGTVLVNGKNLHNYDLNIKGALGYIPQDDLLIEELSVFDNLYYNAKLCFGEKSDTEIQILVNQILEDLALFDQKDLKVGSIQKNIISGGQRKRLNIALELIREPAILFVDEPTSGLSSRDSENVMDLLRNLSLKGKLIFVVIHQPSSEIFKMFDNVLILDEGGRMIYFGNPIEAVVYFKKLDAQINSEIGECPTCGNVNPEQIFNIVDKKVVDEYGRYSQRRKVKPEQWEAFFKENLDVPDSLQQGDPLPLTLKIPSRLKQFKIFTIRNFLSKIANKQYVLLSLLEAPVLGFILSYIIHYIADPQSSNYIFRENDNIPIYIFMSLIVALFISLTISAEEIFRDRKILKREKFLHLSKGSYLISKVFILVCISAIQSYLFLVIGNSILEIKGMNFYYWMALFSTAIFGNLLGLNISASFNSAITIYIIIPLLIIPMMVLSGAMFSFDKLNRDISSIDKVPFLAELMATRWTYEALMVHQFKDNKYEKYYYNLEKQESIFDFELGQKIPALKKSVNQWVTFLNNNKKGNVQPNINLLKNELRLELSSVPQITFPEMAQIDSGNITNSVIESIRQYLNDIELFYGEKLAKTDAKIENITQYMLGQDQAKYKALKDQYFNERVADIVIKRFERNRILIYKDRLIQNYHPVYQDPQPKSYFSFRTHFFAPRKYFMGKYFDTFWFNIAVVWFMIILLYFTLYFDLLNKSFRLFGQISFKKFIKQ